MNDYGKTIWRRAPVVKDVFFDDFSRGIRTEIWRALNERWKSQNNNGYSEKNCLYTTDPESVGREGASGGLVVIRSNGDFSEADKKRQGGGIVTKRLFGAGLYEVRMKVVPRVGQCSACWTYFNDWAKEYAKRKYSEIDIEMPHGGDYRRFSGTTYENYLSDLQKNSLSEIVDCPPLNDGNWHVFAFEWRTDGANGDEGIVWYLDGKPVLVLREAVPHYTATFWVASLFQDAIAWLGDPLFETAYLYLDWVRITEYTDPVLAGSAEAESLSPYTGVDLNASPVPHTEYLANGDFSRPSRDVNFKGREIVSWDCSAGAEIAEGALRLKSGANAGQTIYAQYEGFRFETEIEADIEGGKLAVICEFLKGAANCVDPRLEKLGETEILSLRSSRTERAAFTVPAGQCEHIRIVLRAEGGDCTVRRCSLKRA